MITYHNRTSEVTWDREEALTAMGMTNDRDEWLNTEPVLQEAERNRDIGHYYEPADTWVCAIPKEKPVVVMRDAPMIYKSKSVSLITVRDLDELYWYKEQLTEEQAIKEADLYLSVLNDLPAASRNVPEASNLHYEIDDLEEFLRGVKEALADRE